MAQTADGAHLQGPATPARQLGVARGPRRTPASRSKKPYARPETSATGAGPSDYQSDTSPGFLKGMRSLVSRLWGTSLRPSGRGAGVAPTAANAPEECSMQDPEIQFQTQPAAEPAQRHHLPATFSAASGAPVAAAVAACSGGSDTWDASRYAATVAVRSRTRRPTAESLFAPSPFAYNKRLATATPSVASLRDATRANAETPALSRRHSSLRGHAAAAGPSRGTQAMAHSGHDAAYGDSSASTRYVSPSNARRLLSTLGSINTPILEARSRSAGGLAPAPRLEATVTERPSPMPLRRLPVSLLALSDAPSKAFRSPLISTDSPHGAGEPPRRSTSLRNGLQRRAAAPSLARTIQMQQARRAVAERLFRSKTAGHYASDSEAVASGMLEPQEATPHHLDSGRTRMRESDDDDLAHPKRRRVNDGRALDAGASYEADGAEAYDRRRRVDRPRHAHGRHGARRRGTTSASDSAVKWRFSARLEPPADDGGDSSSESDEDREALTAKVPLSKIRGGELIGLSLRPSVSATTLTNGVGPATVRPTGFGSTRTPVPIVTEAAPTPATLPAPPAVTASAPTSFTLSAAPAPAKEPSPSASVPAALAATPAPAAEAKDAAAAEKPTSTATVEGAGAKDADKTPAAAPAFSFGGLSARKRSSDDSDAAPKPTVPSFSIAGAASITASAAAAEKPAATTAAPAFSFGLPKPAAADGESKPAPSFQFSKPATASTSTPVPKFGAPSTGAAAPAVGAETKPAPALKFTFGSSGATSEAAGEKKNIFAVPGNDTPAASTASQPSLFAPSLSTAGEKRPGEDTAPKPMFTFGSGGGAASGVFGAGAFSTSKPPMFGAAATSTAQASGADSAMDGATAPKAPEAPAAPKPFGGFSFSTPAGSTSGAAATFGVSAPFGRPAKTVDLTQGDTGMDTSAPPAASTVPAANGMDSSPAPAPAPASVFGSGFASFGAKPSFGGFGAAGTSAGSPASGSKPAPLLSFGGASTASSTAPAAKKPAFTFGSLNTPSAASFAATTVPTPTVPSFGSVAATTAPSLGAPAATPSAFNFGAASSPAATPSTAGFSFGAKPALPQATSFGNMSSQPVGGFGSTMDMSTTKPRQPTTLGLSASASSAGAGFGTGTTGSGFGGASTGTGFGVGSTGTGFGAASTGTGFGGASTGTGFGGTSASTGFGAASTGTGFGVASTGTGFGGVSTGTSFGGASTGTGFGAASTGTGFGAASTGTGFAASSTGTGFGGASTGTGFGAASTGSMPFNFSGGSTSNRAGSVAPGGFGGAPSGFGAPSSVSGFGAASNASTGGPPVAFGQAQPAGPGTATPSTSFQFGSSAGGFGASSAAGSTSGAPFAFGSNTAQPASQGGPFQFSAGVAQPSNAAGGGSGFSAGRVPSGSNASTTSRGRQIARPRSRRLH